MKILRKWLLKWVNKAKQEQEPDRELVKSDYGSANMIGSNSSGYAMAKEDVPVRINFNVMPASGGVVITVNKYDRKTNRHIEDLHVIHDDEDVASNIGQIVSMELLRS